MYPGDIPLKRQKLNVNYILLYFGGYQELHGQEDYFDLSKRRKCIFITAM